MSAIHKYPSKIHRFFRARLLESSVSIEPEFCLLSEFFGHSKQRNKWCVNLGWACALIVLALALLAGAAAHLGKMNVVVIDYCATSKEYVGNDEIFASVREVAGYWGEPTWGFFQTCVLPVAVWLAFRFATSAGTALSELEKKGRVRPPNITGKLTTLNAVLCPRICLPLFVLISLACLVTQYRSYQSVSHLEKNAYNEKSWDVGQIQSPFLKRLELAFNNSDNQTKNSFLVGRNQHDMLAKALFEELRAKDHLNDPALMPFLIKDDNGKPVNVDLSKMTVGNNPAAILSLQTVNGTDLGKIVQRLSFFTSIVISQFLTAFGWTLVSWFSIKLLCWLTVVFQALPTDDIHKPSQFKLLLIDPQKRLGLGPLFDPYILIVFLVAIYGFHYALLLSDQRGRAAFTSAGTGGSEVSRLANLIAILVLLASIVVGPMIAFGWRTKQIRKDRFIQITGDCKKTDDEHSLVTLLREEHRVSDQTTWPMKDKLFRAALTTVLAFLIIPVADKNLSLPRSFSTWGNVPKKIKIGLPAFVTKVYHIPPPTPKRLTDVP